MILKFPDLDILKHALLSGIVPAAISTTPATAGFDEQNQLWIEASVTLTRKVHDDLKKLGVVSARKSEAILAADISCWLEMLPLVPEGEIVAPPEGTPVLFDLGGGEHLARMATEILRLGNDRQGYRWLEEKDGTARALLRVIGPPYYSLLRALDAQGPDSPRAFVEKVGRVWVQLGWTHPLVDRIKPPPGQILFLRPPHMWSYLPEANFRDVYDVVEFELPRVAAPYEEGELESKLPVPLQLTRGAGTEAAELWVLRNDPVAALNDLVQKSDNDLLGRLAFAVGEMKGKRTILLRVRPSKLPPPVLVVDAIGFHNYLKLPNLYMPVGWRLHPPLRRDIVRKLLAEDANVLTWLYPEGHGKFTPENISQDAFRPLTDWVEYVIDHERQALTTWVQSMSFDFESYVCDEEGPSKPKKTPPPEKGRGQGRGGHGGIIQEVEVPSAKDEGKGPKDSKPLAFEETVSLVPAEPSAQQLRLRELEEQFVQFEGNLDSSQRLEIWPEMAQLNTALHNIDDAAICWQNTLWMNDDWPEAWLWTWFRTEASAVPSRSDRGRGKGTAWTAAALHGKGRPQEIPGEELDRVLSLAEPTLADVRALTAYLVWAARRHPRPADLTAKRLNAVQRFLAAHETLLSVRAAWLAWEALVRLTNNDVLALARARDRLLERLFQNGLRPEQDLPSFLRFAGQPASQRFRGVRQWLLDLCQTACDWTRTCNATAPIEATPSTVGYVHLLFGYALARLNEIDASRDQIEQARRILGGGEDAHQFLLQAFGHRIKQAQEGRKNCGPLPADQMEYLQKAMEKIQRYAVDRLRSHSRILEPDERIDPYLDWGARSDDLATRLADVVRMTDKKQIADSLMKMMKETPKGGKGQEQRARILRIGLEVSPRVNEEFALEILNQFGPTWDGLPEVNEVATLIERAELLERGLFVAAHFDRKDHVQTLVTRFQKLLAGQRGNVQAMEAIEKLAGESLRGLRKLGMRDEIDVLLRQMADVILQGEDLSALSTPRTDKKWPSALRALLHVAAGWLFFGKERQAEPIISAARALLFRNELPVKDQALLAKVYARTVGGATVEVIQTRLEELFRNVTNIRDTLTTIKFYSLLQLDVVEAVVLAIAGDDNNLGANARRWLDDDEFIVRRRIHRDFHAAKAQHG